MKSDKKLYNFHVENLRAIETAMAQIDSALKVAIKQQRQDLISSYKRLYSLLLGVWAECRLVKLLFEENGFTKKERAYILNNKGEKTRYKQWKKALEIGFRKQFKIKKAKLTGTSLPHSVYLKYETILSILDNDLLPIIEIRNKLAHGQWIHPLNSDQNDVAQKQADFLRTENILSLRFRKTILVSLASLIHDLVVSLPTFNRDFDIHFRGIVEAKRNLVNRDYEEYKLEQVKNYEVGKNKRKSLIRKLEAKI